ncbi:MAG TPA: YiiX/YebB-like N1pC/P60 family cysteine hydrolase [Flavisolibacter sp.]|nr:YiiX/YebB-like N1pC/P60 family cysteine hydrolase [Flavisolibacter sp.]
MKRLLQLAAASFFLLLYPEFVVMRVLLLVYIVVLLFSSCQQKLADKQLPPLSQEEMVIRNLDSLKKIASAGDLLVRLGDDLLSYQIKYLNEADQSYSHAGMIIEKGVEKLVAHITPDDPDKNGINYIPIDSFLNPAKNLKCALYRYTLNAEEKKNTIATIEKYKQLDVQFDRLYNLKTGGDMYCSEMISKAIESATAERIKFKPVNIPVKMQPALYNHFKKQLTKKTIAERKIITIDNLYRIPECSLVMQFQLKYLPGE